MDFSQEYNSELMGFRGAVRSWLDQNFPRGLKIPPDGSPMAPEAQAVIKEFRRKLGAQGWLAPAWPREYGGGGLSPGMASVIQEEMMYLDLPSVGDNYRWVPAMMVWGTPAQKLRYVVPSLRGETITWQAFNEPQSGSDLASVQTLAVRDGEDYLITGQKSFITGRFDPDYLWTLVVTDADRPRRMNLGIFMVDARLPGISIKEQRMLMGSERRLYLEQVRVSSDCLVGTQYQGWEIAQSILEGERGGYGFRASDDETVEDVLQFLRDQ
jgi:alkylation response protein AidB-like acyl-CoA dehydrogenase